MVVKLATTQQFNVCVCLQLDRYYIINWGNLHNYSNMWGNKEEKMICNNNYLWSKEGRRRMYSHLYGEFFFLTNYLHYIENINTFFLLHLKKIKNTSAENLWGYSKWASELNSFCRQIEDTDAAPRLVATNMWKVQQSMGCRTRL